jgi:hypothetical protein
LRSMISFFHTALRFALLGFLVIFQKSINKKIKHFLESQL